jgi:hypothetical protein
MKKDNKETVENKEKDVLISFLKATKNGKYAEIEKTSLKYSRVKEETVMLEEEYYYSIR